MKFLILAIANMAGSATLDSLKPISNEIGLNNGLFLFLVFLGVLPKAESAIVK